MEPGFSIFGVGAQKLLAGVAAPSDGLFIPDSALALDTGKGAESYLSAISLNAKSSLTEAAFASNLDQSITVLEGYSFFTVRGTGNTQYRVDQITINMAKIDDNGTINPNDYS